MATTPPVVSAPEHFVAAGVDKCPTCEQSISHEKYQEIHGRIAAQQREEALRAERRLNERLSVQRAELQSQARDEAKRARAAADAAVAAAGKLSAEREAKARAEAEAAVAAATRASAEREAKARAEAKQAAEAAAAKTIAEAQQARELARRQLNEATSSQAQTLQKQREALEAATVEAVNAEKAKAFNERQKFEGKLETLQRQLQQKSAEELGEGAEVNLFEALKMEFPEDRVRRVTRGTAGADIVHEIVVRGRVCGQIVYDSKNRAAWRNDYVTKLRKDQLSAKADHAILCTLAFPTGAHQIYAQDGVIVVNPARAIVLAQILRKQILQTDSLRLSNEERSTKTSQMYEYINSDGFGQLWSEIDVKTDELLELDVKEQKAHAATWSKRGSLLKTVQKAHGTLTAEIEHIIGADKMPEPS